MGMPCQPYPALMLPGWEFQGQNILGTYRRPAGWAQSLENRGYRGGRGSD